MDAANSLPWGTDCKSEKGPNVTTKEVPIRDPTGSAKTETDFLRGFLGL